MNIVLVASEFNDPIPDKMLEIALRRAKDLDVTVSEVVRVPGAWEIPLAAKTALSRPRVDAVVAIGAIVSGETDHDELIAETVAPELMRLMLETGKPIGLGILGPDITWAQAEARVENAGRAVEAAVRMARAHPRRSRGRR